MSSERPAGPSAQPPPNRMPVAATLEVLAANRGPAHIVVSNQASARLWPTLSRHDLDFNYNPSTMGGAVALGLGLALARSDCRVSVLSGEGSLLMSLGSLVTVAASGATNISIVVLDNAMYEVTGGQQTPARAAEVDFAGLARAAGFPNVSHFWNLADWQRRAAGILAARGPRFVWLEVGPTDAEVLNTKSEPMPQQLSRFQQALAR